MRQPRSNGSGKTGKEHLEVENFGTYPNKLIGVRLHKLIGIRLRSM